MKKTIERFFYAGLIVGFFLPGLSVAQQIVPIIKNNKNISSFGRALESTGLDQKLSGTGPYTIFAPNNEAFNRAVRGKQMNNGSMRSLLLNHIMTGMATERNIKIMSKATSLGGLTLLIEDDNNGTIRINNSRLVQTNMRAGNGVIHVIDDVLQ